MLAIEPARSLRSGEGTRADAGKLASIARLGNGAAHGVLWPTSTACFIRALDICDDQRFPQAHKKRRLALAPDALFDLRAAALRRNRS
jgi:hypothetical protein